jgi:hypothetical protein
LTLTQSAGRYISFWKVVMLVVYLAEEMTICSDYKLYGYCCLIERATITFRLDTNDAASLKE